MPDEEGESSEIKKESKSKRVRRRFRKAFKLQHFHKKVKHSKVKKEYVKV